MNRKKTSKFQGDKPIHRIIAFWLWDDPGWQRSSFLIISLTLILLLPFVQKAFHIDDTLFIKAAKQISLHPGNPYGFNVIWYTTAMPMAEVTMNPPLTSYYIAAVAFFFGWSELALHIAFIPFTILVIIGSYTLACQCKAPPVLAALFCLFSPVILISSTTVMCDIMMLFFFIWAVVFWIRGIDSKSFIWLFGAAGLTIFAVLTKYFAVTLLPLMAIYAIIRYKYDSIKYLLILTLPVLSIIGYQYWTHLLYGHGLFGQAVAYTNIARWFGNSSIWGRIFVGLGFAGAIIPVLFIFIPRVLTRRIFSGVVVCAIAATVLVAWNLIVTGSPAVTEINRFLSFIQLTLLIINGIFILIIVVYSWRQSIDPKTIMLCLWILGVFLFGSIVNWTINARSFLPLVPPVAILLVRLLPLRDLLSMRLTLLGLIITVIISLTVTRSDYLHANSVRTAVKKIMNLPEAIHSTVWFTGHWGFQYYMEEQGARPIDIHSAQQESGDLIVIPRNNSNMLKPKPQYMVFTRRIDLKINCYAAVMNPGLGAGFYSHIFGVFPFSFGKVPDEKYDIFRFRKQ